MHIPNSSARTNEKVGSTDATLKLKRHSQKKKRQTDTFSFIMSNSEGLAIASNQRSLSSIDSLNLLDELQAEILKEQNAVIHTQSKASAPQRKSIDIEEHSGLRIK